MCFLVPALPCSGSSLTEFHCFPFQQHTEGLQHVPEVRKSTIFVGNLSFHLQIEYPRCRYVLSSCVHFSPAAVYSVAMTVVHIRDA